VVTALILIGVVSAIAIASFLSTEEGRMYRRMQTTPRTLIHDARDGEMVKIVGKLRSVGAPLRGPLSGRACSYYKLTVTQNPTGNTSRLVLSEEERRDFILEDPTGRALIRVSRAGIFAKRDLAERSGIMRDPTPEMLVILQRHSEKPRGSFFNRHLKYEEAVLDLVEDVAVHGLGRWEPDPGGEAPASYREAPRRLVLEASSAVPLYVTDDPGVMR
jgi:hypothetical protein